MRKFLEKVRKMVDVHGRESIDIYPASIPGNDIAVATNPDGGAWVCWMDKKRREILRIHLDIPTKYQFQSYSIRGIAVEHKGDTVRIEIETLFIVKRKEFGNMTMPCGYVYELPVSFFNGGAVIAQTAVES